ncbi:YidC/Oxa1 family membrane protein insertase [Salinibacterium soli]|uniref:Membrane protein insertase YidC n=1 Tax=Antiquaquibacter soli TaxID=3064523 RepID=A0ABT9BN01_9MICO|nr:membrane protein insertase YidC [Protaetiibacter sp. WY-16]MDO7882409.1 membrane protein insertase YidC [Protaetiibacter sp. WY-16]
MDLYSFAPIAAVLDAAHSVITALIGLLDPVAGGLAAALAVVLVTVVVRLALLPASIATVRGEIERRRLAPRLAALRKRYSSNPELLQRKTMELYSSERVSPFAGCVPALIQAPILSVLYALFAVTVIGGHPNALLEQQFLGLPLGTSFLHAIGAGSPPLELLVFVVLLSGIGLVAWFSRRVTQRYTQSSADEVPAAVRSMAGILSWMPFLTIVFAALVPLAATLYLAVSTTWTLVERQVLRRVLDPGPGAAPVAQPS